MALSFGARWSAATLGLPEAHSKAYPPGRSIIWLGIHFDTVAGLIRIPDAKIEETITMVHSWINMRRTTLKKLQSLLGKLLHVAQCSSTECSPHSRAT